MGKEKWQSIVYVLLAVFAPPGLGAEHRSEVGKLLSLGGLGYQGKQKPHIFKKRMVRASKKSCGQKLFRDSFGGSWLRRQIEGFGPDVVSLFAKLLEPGKDSWLRGRIP